MTEGNHGVIERLWTNIGLALAPMSVWYVFYIRGGINIFGSDTPSESLQITMAGWGILVFNLELSALALLGLMYIKELGETSIQTPWPANTQYESDNRNIRISRIFLILYIGVPLFSMVMGIIRYSDSHIAAWSSNESLAPGFWRSRYIAYSIGCDHSPCYRVHPTQGHEYILYLTDGVLLITTMLSFIMCAKWIIAIIRHLHNKSKHLI